MGSTGGQSRAQLHDSAGVDKLVPDLWKIILYQKSLQTQPDMTVGDVLDSGPGRASRFAYACRVTMADS